MTLNIFVSFNSSKLVISFRRQLEGLLPVNEVVQIAVIADFSPASPDIRVGISDGGEEEMLAE